MQRRKKRIEVEEEEEEEAESDGEMLEMTAGMNGIALAPMRRATLLSLVREDRSEDALLDHVVAFLPVRDALALAQTCAGLMGLPSHASWATWAKELGARVPTRLKEEGGLVKTWKNAYLLASGFACSDCRLGWDWKLSDACAGGCGRYLCEDCAQGASCCGEDKRGSKYCLRCTNFSCCGNPKCIFTVCNVCQTLDSYPERLPQCVCGMRSCPEHPCRCPASRPTPPVTAFLDDYKAPITAPPEEDDAEVPSSGGEAPVTPVDSTTAYLLSTIKRIVDQDEQD
jgi:hypothetical protein